MTWIDIAVLILYFGAMVGIGIWAMRRIKNQEDYFMGGRGFGKLLQTFAAFGAGTGAHEPVTVGRTGWTSGLSGVWSALMWLFVTPIYWITGVWYRRMRHLTLGDWFVERYESKAMGAAYTVFAIIFYMTYLSTMFSAIAKFAVPLLGVESLFGVDLQYTIIPVIAVVVIIYGVLGGLTAAYWTDLIQGIFIIILSVLLIPFGLWALVKEFGDPQTMGLLDGFTIMHERVSSDYFSLFSGPSAGEFPIQYIISLTLLALIGIVVQPHFIATGGGSAKSEDAARIGLVTGNFLKRLCTIGWAITALIALALLAGNAEIAADPDRVWGVAAREILGPLNMGLVGLMLACLLAAMMSSADAYMIVTSGLVSRNVFAAYINPKASERTYLFVARITGLVIIVGASIFALTMADVFGQFKLALELPILFAAPFWIGMFWRRANRVSVWITIGFSFVLFLILPGVIPYVPGIKTNPDFTITTNIVTTTFTREATPADVAQREAWEANHVGHEPPVAVAGLPIEITIRSGGQSIFWQGGVNPQSQQSLKTISKGEENGKQILVQQNDSPMIGTGDFRIDFLFYQWLGFDLANASKATIETLRLPTRLVLPFLVLIIASFFTPRNTKEALDRYYVKMKTEVDPDHHLDRQNLEKSYQNPDRFNDRLLFPGTEFEFVKPRPKDYIGFLASVAVCFVMVGILLWLASIGA
ncbi:MAG: sodium:solute symporter family protein [Verrucomicrobia bacterium]|nr:sodium:solute symporter family protein [Verrucomicrobiota bacterium]